MQINQKNTLHLLKSTVQVMAVLAMMSVSFGVSAKDVKKDDVFKDKDGPPKDGPDPFKDKKDKVNPPPPAARPAIHAYQRMGNGGKRKVVGVGTVLYGRSM